MKKPQPIHMPTKLIAKLEFPANLHNRQPNLTEIYEKLTISPKKIPFFEKISELNSPEKPKYLSSFEGGYLSCFHILTIPDIRPQPNNTN